MQVNKKKIRSKDLDFYNSKVFSSALFIEVIVADVENEDGKEEKEGNGEHNAGFVL